MIGSERKHPILEGIAAVFAMSLMLLPAMAQEESAPETPPKSFNLIELPANFGWLSDPQQKPDTFLDALAGGKISVNNRLRWEYVDQDTKRTANAITNRTRFGYTTKAYQGFSFMVEAENLAAVNGHHYFVPRVGQGDPARAVVADPAGMELNQYFGRYKTDFWGIDLKVGRQRLILDDHRFVGNVGWRQREQTMDAFRLKTNLGLKKLEIDYSYVWYVLGIFGPNGNPFESNINLIHISYNFRKEFKLTAFAYLMEFDTAETNSSNTYGVRATGTLDLEKLLNLQDFSSKYELTYAHQTDGGDNPLSYDADFYAIDLKVIKKGMGFVGAGYQNLGSDNGVVGFKFPLGTNHKFNGWADLFLATPAAGLEDLYVYAGTTLPWNIKGKIFLHEFYQSKANQDLGWEVDWVMTKKITKNWSVLTKFAHYQNDGSLTRDTDKFWLQTTFSF